MIKDSGERREFEEGGVRDMAEGKGRFDLIPWETILDLAKHFEEGAKKYEENNWKLLPTWTFMDSGMRHLAKHKIGYKDENHLISAIWNLVCLYYLENRDDNKFKG